MADKPAIIAWSHSRVETFKKCPKQFHHTALLKDVPFEQSAAQMWGDRVHKALDARIKHNMPLPAEMVEYEALAVSVKNAPGETYTELQMTLNPALSPTGWFAKDAYVRVIVDVLKLQNKNMAMLDWKTGKPRFDSDQLKLFAAVGFQTYPEVERITSAYVWTQTKMMDPAVYTRDQLPQMWKELLQEPTKMQEAYVTDNWPAKPGRWCKWCGVNKFGKCAQAAERYSGD